MTVFAAPSRTSSVSEPLCRDVDEFLDLVVCDLPSGDITGRLKRLGYVRDRLNLAFSKDAARLSAEFREEETANGLEAPTAGEWIRHNCKMKSGAAYDCINVGEQLPRIAKCVQAMVEGEIGFAHLSVIARTASALSKAAPESIFEEDDVLEHARGSSAGRLWHYCERLRHALDPEGVEQDHRVAVEERRLQLRVWEDGSLQISGKLDRSAERHYAPPSSRSHSRWARATIAASSVALAMGWSNCRFIRSMPGSCRSTRASAHTSRSRRPSKRSKHYRDRPRLTWSSRRRSRPPRCSDSRVMGTSPASCSLRTRSWSTSAGRREWFRARAAAP